MSERGIPMLCWQLQLCCWHCQAREPVLPLIRSSRQLDLGNIRLDDVYIRLLQFALVFRKAFYFVGLNMLELLRRL